jgi:hypothetical protein
MTPSDIDTLASRLAARLVTPRWLRMRQATEYAGMGKAELRSLLRAGDIAGYQRNDRGDWIIDRISIDRFHEGNMGTDIEKEAKKAMQRLGVE